MLGYPVGLGAPEWLLLGFLALAVGAVAAFAAFRRRARVRQLLGERLGDSLAPGVEVTRPVVRAASTALSLLLFSLAMSQPQCGSRAELTKKRGIDVVVALDASKSMRARDVLPSRLERAKLELSTLLDELKGDRVAIVAFAGDAFVQCPLTSDYAAAKLFLRAIDPEQMQEGGTNIGAALATAEKVLEDADRGAKDRVVVLLSDGEDLSGEVGEASEALKAAGIKVFTIGIGSADRRADPRPRQAGGPHRLPEGPHHGADGAQPARRGGAGVHRPGDRRRVLPPRRRGRRAGGGGPHRPAAEDRAREPDHRPLRRAVPGLPPAGPASPPGGDGGRLALAEAAAPARRRSGSGSCCSPRRPGRSAPSRPIHPEWSAG